LQRVPFLIRLSRVTRKVVIQNLCFGIVFITVGLFVTGKGWVPPILAVMLHLASSLVIVFNSARLVRYGEELTVAEAGATATEGMEAAGQPAPAV
jgi:Cd2+/Zn2+-exporting ATPase